MMIEEDLMFFILYLIIFTVVYETFNWLPFLTLPAAIISLVRKKNIKRSALAIMVIPAIKILINVNRNGLGPTGFEYVLSQLQEGNILILLSCSGYLYLLYWWVLFIKKGNKGETSFTMSKKQIVILVSLLATALSSWFFLSLTTYRPRRGDVVQDQYTLKNTDKLDAFMADAAKGKEEKIRVVVRIFKKSSDHPDGPKGAIIYDLQSRHDAKAKESWIEVRPDLRYFNQSKATQFLIINNPQQCGSVIKDEEKGYYLLTQCHDAWSYELFPLKGTAGSDMERMGP
jgi:hypothetical protein